MDRSRADRLSIIIPTLNEVADIGALLRDLAPLRPAGHEVILVDGGSSDATLALAAPDVDTIIDSPPGRARQLNAGATKASGDVLWFLHADTRVPDDAAATLLAAMAEDGDWGRFDVQLSGSDWRLRLVERLMNLRSRLSGIATGDQGIFVERGLFEAAGGFPAIALMEDIALSRTLRRMSNPLCIRRPRLLTSSRRWESHGVVRTVLLMWWLRLSYALGRKPEALARHYR